MKNGIATLCLGVWMVLFLGVTHAFASSSITPNEMLYYHLRVDTAGVDLGYLRLDPADNNNSRLIIDRTKDERSLWQIKSRTYGSSDPINSYHFVNKYSGDSLCFAVPFTKADTLTEIVPGGLLKRWEDILFNNVKRDSFKTYAIETYPLVQKYYLTYDAGEVYLSPEGYTSRRALMFTIERHKYLPDENEFYQLKLDTVGMPDIPTTGFLYTDTSARLTGGADSLIVSNQTDDLSYWKFVTDTVVADTTYFKIYNKKTDSLLAFDIPENDTLAIPRHTGVLNQWKMPFFAEDNRISRFVTRDTVGKKDYYLAMTSDSVIMLVTDTTAVKPLFMAYTGNTTPPVDELDSAIVDSTNVYRVKYIAGPNAVPGKFLASTEKGERLLLDTVYAHVPNGQFVINRSNRFSLSNRLSLNIKTDSLFVVLDAGGDTIKNQYHNRARDTFEIRAIDYGNIENLKLQAHLGYKYMLPEDLAVHSYAFSFQSLVPADTLNGLIMGHGSDSVMMLLPMGDTIAFIMERSAIISAGAPAIGRIPRIERVAYSLRSMIDSTLYISASSPMQMDVYANRTSFLLKEDTIANTGKYYFIDYNGGNMLNKLLANDEKQFNLVKLDSVDMHLFSMIPQERYVSEPDDFEYLTDLEDILIGKNKGYYEFRIMDTQMQAEKWLVKNYYHYAVLGKEGESMLRAGSYTPYDLRLWVDTARGVGFNPDKPSFYIVSDVDTTVAGFNGFNITGYFLHVMDSTSLADFDEYVVYNEDSTAWYNRANFEKAMRFSADELRRNATLTGTNDLTGDEFRFYLQKTGDNDGKYYLVTEAGYGDGGRTNARGYLSVDYSGEKNRIYFGPRADAAKISFSSSTVSNEIIVEPPVKEEQNREVMIIGRTGELGVLNASGQELIVFNVLGQPVTKKILSSDNESIPVSRGIMIVKVGTKTQKVVVK